jgi:hypothetical protein
MEAFDAEHKDGPAIRLDEKVLLDESLTKIQQEITNAFAVPSHILALAEPRLNGAA